MTRIAWVGIAIAFAATGAAADCPDRGLPAPSFSAAQAADFPSKIGPALTGPFAKLAWGMPGDRVKAALPAELRAAVYDDSGPIDADVRKKAWAKLGDGEVQIATAFGVLVDIHLRFRDRASALAALAAWKAPAAPDNPQSFEFWTSAAGGARALLRPDDAGAVVELAPYAPLASLIGGKLVAKRSLIGTRADDVCLVPLDRQGEAFLLPASERSSGPLGMEVHYEDGKIDGYEIPIDYTYDRDVKTQIPALLAKQFGKASVWKHPMFVGVTCSAYGKAPIVYACDGEETGHSHVWRIFVGEEPNL